VPEVGIEQTHLAVPGFESGVSLREVKKTLRKFGTSKCPYQKASMNGGLVITKCRCKALALLV
jgi:hypothetical protein